VANEIGMVVISIGKDDGVLEGDEFTAYRGGDFVAKIVLDRADRKWAAGKIVLKKTDPRVGDDVSNHIYVSGPRSGSTASCVGLPGGKVTATADEAGLVLISLGMDDGARPGDEFEVLRSGETMARIVIERADRQWAAGKIVEKKRDPKVTDDVVLRKAAVKKTTSDEERLDLQSAATLELIRFKMGLKE